MRQKIKAEQKALAQKIRESRPNNQYLSWKFRHRHIVYCQLFNKTPYELIEKPRQGNEPDQTVLGKYRLIWSDETVRSNS